MRLYEYYLLDSDVGYTVPTVPIPADFKIGYVDVTTTSPTTATITCTQPTTVPNNYSGGIVTEYGSLTSPSIVLNSTSRIIYQTGLYSGVTYNLRIRAESGTGTYGEYYYTSFTMPAVAKNATIVSTVAASRIPYDPRTAFSDPVLTEQLFGNKSLGAISSSPILYDPRTSFSDPDLTEQLFGTISQTTFKNNENTSENEYSTATKGIRSIGKSLLTLTAKTPGKYSLAETSTGISESSLHYSFGTGFFFPRIDGGSVGGFGFFTKNNGSSGYYISIKTQTNSNDNKEKLLNVYKIVGNQIILLPDSQAAGESFTVPPVLQDTEYKLDIKVKIQKNLPSSNDKVTINLYINNFRITAFDTTTFSTPDKTILSATNKIALFTQVGKINFDYVYAYPTTEDIYNKGVLNSSYNGGQFSNGALNFLFGERVVSNLGSIDKESGFLREFGLVARELRKIKIKYNDAPGFPSFVSSSMNPYVHILGSRLTTHGAEIYVINNAGVFTPLSDGNQYSFTVVGRSIHAAGEYEYSDTEADENSVEEPASFKGTWIQRESDAKNLAYWAKSQWAKQQQIINLSVFGNPFISVGDVIAISYPSNNLDGTQKFLVTDVNNSFNQGLETSISARSIYI